MHSLGVARDADIGDKRRKGTTLHTWHGLGLRRCDSRVQSVSASITHLLAQASQIIDIARVHGQSVDGHVVSDAIRVCPFLESTQAAVEHIFLSGPGRFELKGTLKEMLTRRPPGMFGLGLIEAPGIELPGMGRLSGGGVTDMSC